MATTINAGTVTLNTGKAVGNINTLNKSLNNVQQPLGKINSNFKEFEKSLDAATARVVAFTATTGLIYGIGDAISRLTRDAIEVEAAMTKVQAILKVSDSELKNLAGSLFTIANSTGQTFGEAAKALEEFARQGLNTEKTLKATEAALIVARLSGANLEDTINGLVATVSSFSNELLDYGRVANTLVGIDAKFSTSAAGLIEGIKRVGSVASDAGVTFEELSSAIAAVRQVTGRSESVIGNGLKTIFTNLQTDKVRNELAKLGIQTQSATGEFLPLINVVDQLAGAFQKLNDAQRADLGQKIAGKYQINTFKALIQSFGGADTSLFDQAMNTARMSQDEAIKRNELLNQTTAATLTKLNNTITELGASFGNKITKPLIDSFATLATTGINVLTDVFKDNPIGDFLSGGIISALKGPGLALAIIAVGKLTKRIAFELSDAIKSVSGLNQKEKDNLIINNAILQALKNENDQRVRAVLLASTLEDKQRAINALLKSSYPSASGTISPAVQLVDPKVRKQVLSSPGAAKLASGYIPTSSRSAMMDEMASIQNGVGGARKTAKAVPARINMAGGSTPVVVNTDEHIIRNFQNSGQDAVFNRQMTQRVGGVSNLKKFGKVEKVMANGYVPNFANRKLLSENPFVSTTGQTFGLDPAKIDFIRKITENITGVRTNPIRFRKLLGDNAGEFWANSNNVFLNTDVIKSPGKKNQFTDPMITAAHEYGHFIEHNADPELMNAFYGAYQKDRKKKGSLFYELTKKIGYSNADTYTKKQYFSESFADTFGYSFLDTPARNYALGGRSMSEMMFELIGKNIPRKGNRNFADGFTPDMSVDDMIRMLTMDINIDEPKNISRSIRRGIDKKSFLRFAIDKKKRNIEIEDIESYKKGDAFKNFKELSSFAKKRRFTIYSPALIRQKNRDKTSIGGMNLLYSLFPQLRYRDGVTRKTSGQYSLNRKNYNFKNLDDLKNQIGRLSDDDIRKIAVFRDINDSFAQGLIPNFAKKSSNTKDELRGKSRIGTVITPQTINKRFKFHYERGKDYESFYSIVNKEGKKAGLSDTDLSVFAGITSAISPRSPDYLAAQAAPVIFNHYLKTRSKNPKDYLDLEFETMLSKDDILDKSREFKKQGIDPKTIDFSQLKKKRTVQSLGHFGPKGAKNIGLAKALSGQQLGANWTSKTRQYQGGILGNLDAFPIDTNVQQAILPELGKKDEKGGTIFSLTKREEAEVILLARKFAKANKLPYGAAGLQAAIFKSNSKFKDKYTPEFARQTFSKIDRNFANGYIPNFADTPDMSSIVSELDRLSPSQRLKFAKTNFPKLGKGSSRIVYDIGGAALKLPLNQAGIAQNAVESDPYRFSDESQLVLPKIFERGGADEFLIAQLAEKYNAKDFKKTTGTSINALSSDLLNYQLRIGRPNIGKKARSRINYDNPYVKGFKSLVDEGLLAGDFRSANVGFVTEPDVDSFFPDLISRKRPVLLDYGYDENVRNNFYRRRNLGKKFADGYIPNFAREFAAPLIIRPERRPGKNLLLTSPYDSLMADNDPSSDISGGISYGVKFPDRSYASTARAKGVDVMQALYNKITKQGGRVYYTPHVPVTAMKSYGTKGGGINKRNIHFLKAVVGANKKDFPRDFIELISTMSSSQASLIQTGELYDIARQHLQMRGYNAIQIGKKFREAADPLHDPIVKAFSDKNKFSVSGPISRVDSVRGSVIAPNSYHPLYPSSTYSSEVRTDKVGIDILDEIYQQTGLQPYSGGKTNAKTEETKGPLSQPTASFLPYGILFDDNDEIAQKFGLANGYVPNFNNNKAPILGAFKNLNRLRKEAGIKSKKATGFTAKWSPQDKEILLRKPTSTSSEDKMIEVLSLYAHEFAHTSQFNTGEDKMKLGDRMSPMISQMYQQMVGKSKNPEDLKKFHRAVLLKREQDAWYYGEQFIPDSIKDKYKAQAKKYYATYDKDFDLYPDKAMGYIPNFAKGEKLGQGLYGSFYKLRNNIGVKRFDTTLSEAIANSKKGIDNTIALEYRVAKKLSENKELESVGITAPKVIGTLENSIKRKRIGKEVVTGSLLGNVRGVGMDLIGDVLLGIDDLVSEGEFESRDLHDQNVMINNKGVELLKKYTQKYGSRFKEMLEDDDLNRTQKLFSAFARRGGRFSIIDPGMFVERGSNYSKGYIPNFADGLKDSVNREVDALVGMGYPKSLAMGSVKVGTSERLKNKNNPNGLGVYNLAQGQMTLGQAIGQHSNESQSKKFVPNFVSPKQRRQDAARQYIEDEISKLKFDGLDDKITEILSNKISKILPQAEIDKYQKDYLNKQKDAFDKLKSQTGIFSSEKKIVNTAEQLGISTGSNKFLDMKSGIEAKRGRILSAAAFGLPFAVGGISSALGGEKTKGGRIATAVGEAAGTVALGAQFGPLGLAVSGVVASLQLLTSVSKEFRPNLEELSKKSQELAATNEREISSLQQYSQSLSQLATLVEGNASVSAISQAKIALSQSAAGVSGPFRDKLINAKTDDERTKVIQDATLAAQKQQASLDTQTLIAGTIEQKYSGLSGAWKQGPGMYLSGPDAIDASTVSRIGRELTKSVDTRNLSEETVKKLTTSSATLSDLGIDPKIFENVDKYFGKIISSGEKASDVILKYAQTILLNQKATEDLISAQVDAAAAFGQSKQLFLNLLQTTFTSNELKSAKTASSIDLGLNSAKNLLDSKKDLLSPEALIRGQEMIAVGEINSKAAVERNSLGTEASQKIISDILSKSSNISLEKQTKVQDLIKTNMSSEGGFDPNKLAQEIQGVLDPETGRLVQNDLLKVNIEMAQKLSQIDSKAAEEVQKTSELTALAQKQLNDSRLLNLLGGYNSDFKQILKSIKKPSGGYTQGGKYGEEANLGGAKQGTTEGADAAQENLQKLQGRIDFVKNNAGLSEDQRKSILSRYTKQAEVLRKSQIKSETSVLGQDEIIAPLEEFKKTTKNPVAQKAIDEQIKKYKASLEQGEVPVMDQNFVDLLRSNVPKGDERTVKANSIIDEITTGGQKPMDALLKLRSRVTNKDTQSQIDEQLALMKKSSSTGVLPDLPVLLRRDILNDPGFSKDKATKESSEKLLNEVTGSKGTNKDIASMNRFKLKELQSLVTDPNAKDAIDKELTRIDELSAKGVAPTLSTDLLNTLRSNVPQGQESFRANELIRDFTEGSTIVSSVSASADSAAKKTAETMVGDQGLPQEFNAQMDSVKRNTELLNANNASLQNLQTVLQDLPEKLKNLEQLTTAQALDASLKKSLTDKQSSLAENYKNLESTQQRKIFTSVTMATADEDYKSKGGTSGIRTTALAGNITDPKTGQSIAGSPDYQSFFEYLGKSEFKPTTASGLEVSLKKYLSETSKTSISGYYGKQTPDELFDKTKESLSFKALQEQVTQNPSLFTGSTNDTKELQSNIESQQAEIKEIKRQIDENNKRVNTTTGVSNTTSVNAPIEINIASNGPLDQNQLKSTVMQAITDVFKESNVPLPMQRPTSNTAVA